MRGGKREFGGGGGGGHRKKAKWFNHKAVRLTTMHSMNFSGKSVFFLKVHAKVINQSVGHATMDDAK